MTPGGPEMSNTDAGNHSPLDDGLRVAAAKATVCGLDPATVAEMLDVDVTLVERWAAVFVDAGERAVTATRDT